MDLDVQKTISVTQETSDGASTPPTTPETLLREALHHHQVGRWQEAENLYRQRLVLQPDHAYTLHQLGTLCYQQQKNLLAVEWFSKAVAAIPNQPVFLFNLGVTHSALGHLPEAIDCFQKVLLLQPDHGEALPLLGDCWRSQGNRSAAIACYRQAIALRPNLHEVYNSLGNLLLAEGEAAEAIACYRKTVEIHPNHSIAYTNLGNIFSEQGDAEEAVRCFEKAIEIQPTLCEAHNGLGIVLKKEGQLDEALACFGRAVASNPHYYMAYHNQGLTLQLQGKREEAVVCYRKTLTIQPDCAVTCTNLGLLLQDLKHFEEAEAVHQYALSRHPDDATTHHHLGHLLAKQGRLEEAETAYQHALQIRPDYAEAYNNLGNLRQTQARSQEAEDAYRQALILNPDYADAQYNLGILLQDQERFQEAEAAYRQALRSQPDHDHAYNNLTNFLQKQFLGRVLKSTDPLPLSAAFASLWDHVRRAPRNDRLLAWGQRILQIDPGQLADWHERAFWGFCASFAITSRLSLGRASELTPFVREPDWGKLTKGDRQGTILVGAHVGPDHVAAHCLQKVHPDAMIPATDNAVHYAGLVNLKTDYLRERSMAMAALHLRRGGVLFLAGDGHVGSHPLHLPFMGGYVSLQPTIPHLIQRTGARACWLVALWEENEIVCHLEPFPPLTPHDEGNWPTLWLTTYLDQLAQWYRQDPRHLRLDGGVWGHVGETTFPPFLG